ncbi:hypothetical protein MWU49_11495 [Alcanivorax sp. S6407]|uniref:hypothetical protein n=1 Tax=Alcanivorax sp. S6407 TaxID=2926424 RepID=UPI001FF4708F|nr:hypothetical protein [Alcanivorax sp. S6407]MCK0154329.1 hypothetical protein [Alcanivorax sp. S6407]
MEGKLFAKVIAQVVETQSPRELNESEQAKFHQELEETLGQQVENLRSEKRRAYEEFKSMAIS